jgi:hypothetical protein
MGDQQRCVCDACGEEFDTEAELHKHLYAVGLVD